MDAIKSRPLKQGCLYHFNVIYNYARCPLSTTEDTQLSLAWTQRAVDILHQQGMVSGYYHDRDCPKGQGIVTELTQVIKASELTLVLLSPGFVRDCWPRYWLLSSFRSLFESSSSSSSMSTFSSARSPSLAPSLKRSASPSRLSPVSSSIGSSGDSGRSEVVLVALGLEKGDLPGVLQGGEVLFFARDWQHDLKAWHGLQGALGLEPSSSGECLAETSDVEQSSEPSLHSSGLSSDSPGPERQHSPATSLHSQSSLDSRADRSQRHQEVSEDSALSLDDQDEPPDVHSNKQELRKTAGFLSVQKHGEMRRGRVSSQGTKESQSLEKKEKQTSQDIVCDEVESAVLERLGNTGLRRESLEENTITRVFVHGNTVAIDTLRTNRSTSRSKEPSPRATEDRQVDSKLSSERCSQERGPLSTPTAKDRSSDFSFTHQRDMKTNTLKSRHSELSSQDPTLSTQSPRRTLQYSEEYGYSSDPSYSISLTTEHCERLAGSQRSDKRDGVSRIQLTARTEKPVEETPYRTSVSSSTNLEDRAFSPHQKTVPFSQDCSPRKENKVSSLERDDVDSIANNMALNHSTSATANFSGYDRGGNDNTNPQHSTQSIHTKEVPRSKNQVHDSVNISTEKSSSRNAENQHQQPHEDIKLLVSKSRSPRKEAVESMSTKDVQETYRKEVEESMTKQKVVETTSQNNFITSIEDEHEIPINDLSGSWTTSEYGTMSPRHDLSCVSQDSGFLSSGLASFSHPASWTNDSKSKTQDVLHHPGSVGDGKSSDAKASDAKSLNTKASDAKSLNTKARSSDAKASDAKVLPDDFKSSDPPLVDRFQKSSHREATKPGIGFLEKSSMTVTKTSLGHDNRLLQTQDFQTGDTFDDRSGTSITSSFTLEESSRLTVKNSSQNAQNVISKEMVTAEHEAREGNLSAAQRAVSGGSRKDDVLCETSSARASRSSAADSRALIRKDSWIYVDVDKGWTVSHILLPLYHVLCYALSRPELPYF